ncbi:trans-sialidase, putative [Trypanosoma cruzi]
MPYR